MNFHIQSPNEEEYTVVLLHNSDPLLFIGTSKGCLEMWNIDTQEKVAELRYLEVNDFGEHMPVDDPVIAVEPNHDYTLVYVLMGNAAYCVDVEMRLIIQQIPITETVIAGCVSGTGSSLWGLGTIAVITEVGYLSFWSPKFYERIASHELMKRIEKAFLLFMDNEVILLLPDSLLIFGNDGKRYLASVDMTELNIKFQALLEPRKVSQQGGIFAVLNETVSIGNKKPDVAEILIQSREQILSQLIGEISNIAIEKEYIEDFRLHRGGKDRYLAERDAVENKKEDMGGDIVDDDKTLSYAFDEINSDNIHKKAVAQDVISRISRRHHVSSIFLETAWKWGSIEPISFGIWLEFETNRRQMRIRQFIISLIPVMLMLLILSFQILSLASFFLQLVFITVAWILIWRWGRLNTDPEMVWIETYRIARFTSYIFLLYMVYRIINLYTNYGIYLPDF